MRPPICAVCESEIDLARMGRQCSVRFVSRPSDVAWREQALESGIVGHPPDTEWFCAQHIDRAQELAATEHIDAALRLLQAAPEGDAPVIGAVERYLRDSFVKIASDLGLSGLPTVVSDQRRDVPMDGSVAPDCSFVLTTRHFVATESQSLELVFERAHWNEIEVARARVVLDARGERAFTLSASTPDAGGSLVLAGLMVSGADANLVASVVEGIRSLPARSRSR